VIADEKFFDMCEQELNMMDLFFKNKLAKAQRKYNELIQELEVFNKQEVAEKDNAKGAKEYSI
jgi:hypothetical protein